MKLFSHNIRELFTVMSFSLGFHIFVIVMTKACETAAIVAAVFQSHIPPESTYFSKSVPTINNTHKSRYIK